MEDIDKMCLYIMMWVTVVANSFCLYYEVSFLLFGLFSKRHMYNKKGDY